MAAALPLRSIVVGAALFMLSLTSARFARADECIDASDEARAAMKARHLLEARAKLRRCAATECAAEVRTICEERLVEVTERLPTIVFDAKRPDGTDLSEVTTTIDGLARADVAMGAELPLDPGPHTIVFRDAAGTSVERRIVMVEREKGRRERVIFTPAEAPKVAPPTRILVPTLYAPARSAVVMHDAGLFALGGAAVSVVLGSVFGGIAIAQNDAAGCDATNVCEAPEARSRARMAASVSTVSFVAAAGLAVVGIGLLLWPKPPPRPVRATATGTGALRLGDGLRFEF